MYIRKVTIIVVILFFFSIGIPKETFSQSVDEKVILIVLDSLDFETLTKIANGESAIGIMNIKAENLYKVSNPESLMTTIAIGKRINVKGGLFKGVVRDKTGGLFINGYEEILKDIEQKGIDHHGETSFLAEFLRNNHIEIGYIGNDSSSILVADRNGYIRFGEDKIEYNINWLKNKTRQMFNSVDVLVISYDIYEDRERIEIIKKYIREFDNYYIMMFPKQIQGDIDIKWNTTLTPVIYKTPENLGGILRSKTTKREGIITNLDVYPNIAAIYGIDTEALIGNKIEIRASEDALDKTKQGLIEFLNLNIIKYVCHGMVVILQLFIIIKALRKKNYGSRQYKSITGSIVIGIYLSFILGVLKLHRIIPLYVIVLLSLTVFTTLFFMKKNHDIINNLSILTNITILFGIFVRKNIIYDSYIGYNNIVAGGRFYGLNNEIMGVLLVTTIISFYYILDKIKVKAIQILLLLFYFSIVILALSSRFGANFGGYFTAIALLLMMIYVTIFDRRINKRNLIALLLIGLVIFGLNLYIDLSSVDKSHAGRLLVRSDILGYKELGDIFLKKVKQLFLMVIVPPWSLILVGQLYFITSFYKRNKILVEHLKTEKPNILKKSFIIFATSLVALVINDTGVIAFVYMNTYLVSIIVSLHNVK